MHCLDSGFLLNACIIFFFSDCGHAVSLPIDFPARCTHSDRQATEDLFFIQSEVEYYRRNLFMFKDVGDLDGPLCKQAHIFPNFSRYMYASITFLKASTKHLSSWGGKVCYL